MSRVVGIFYNPVADSPVNERILLNLKRKYILAQTVLDDEHYFYSELTMKSHLLALAVTLACTLPV